MYYRLLLRRFIRSRATQWAFALLMILGVVSIGIGKQFIAQQDEKISKAWEQQAAHIERQVKYHPDDIGLIMYYLQFSFINPTSSLAGVAIGQRDLHANVQNITMLGLEGQRYDTDLLNPVKLQVGNLDLSFVIIFLFPLVIIALCFSLLHEEVERETWRMIRVQGVSLFCFYLAKFSIRWLFINLALALLLLIAGGTLGIPVGRAFGLFCAFSFLYINFWLAICFALISFQKSSGLNAISLLTLWLVLVVLLPVGINSYVTQKYPVGEALSLTIKQRDEYHHRWDTDKQETMDKFNRHYPQFAHYPLKKEGFSWHWYYAMQQMGDDQSVKERHAMQQKIHQREALSMHIAQFLPTIGTQLALNRLAHTDLESYLRFLEATEQFHEGIRLDFYPYIFEDTPATQIHWKKYVPQYHTPSSSTDVMHLLWGIILPTFLLIGVGIWRSLRLR